MSEKITSENFGGVILSTRKASSEEIAAVADVLAKETGNGAIIHGPSGEVLAASTPEGARIAQETRSQFSMSDLGDKYNKIFRGERQLTD